MNKLLQRIVSLTLAASMVASFMVTTSFATDVEEDLEPATVTQEINETSAVEEVYEVDEEPVVEEPTGEEPTVDETDAEEPAAEESTGEESAGEESAGDETDAEEPAGEEPAGEEPAGEEPAAEESAAEEPAVEDVIIEEVDASVEVMAAEEIIEEPMFSVTEVIDGETWYGISTAEELAAIENDMTANYYLTENIVLSGSWTPLGFKASTGATFAGTAFTGNFDGRGNTISGLYISQASYCNVGLFAYIKGSVYDFNLEFTSIYGKQYVGAVCGGSYGAVIEDVHVTGGTMGNHSTTTCVGGISGVSVYGSINRCSTDIEYLKGISNVGGLVGYLQGTLTYSYSTSGVIGSSSSTGVGGLAGYTNYASGKMTGCYYVDKYNTFYGKSTTGAILGYHGQGGFVTSYCFAVFNSTSEASSIGAVGGTTGNYSYCYKAPATSDEYILSNRYVYAVSAVSNLLNDDYTSLSKASVTIDGTAYQVYVESDDYDYPILFWQVEGWNESEPTEYTVTYDAGIATDATIPVAVTAEDDTEITLGTATADGYTFTGWLLGDDTLKTGDTYTVTGNVTLTAQWVEDLEDLTLTITGGSDGSETTGAYGAEALTLTIDVEGGKADYTVVCDVEGALLDIATATGDGTITVYAPGDYYVQVTDGQPESETEPFNIAEVSFNSDGGSDVASQLLKTNKIFFSATFPTSDDVTVDMSMDLSAVSVQNDGASTATPVAVEPVAPTKTDYVFADWTLNGAAYDFANTPVTNSIELVATWAEDSDNNGIADDEENWYDVTFSKGTIVEGDTVEGIPEDMEDVKEGTEITLAEPTREGVTGWDYQFTGWSDGEITYQAGEEYPVTGDATLTATWSLYSIDGDMIWNVFDAMEIMGQYDGSVFLTDEQLAVGDYDGDGTTSTVFDAMEIMEMYKNETID